MAIAIDPREKFEYILEADRDKPEDEQTVWELRALTFAQRNALEDMPTFTGEKEVAPKMGKMTRETLRAGLAGWRNFKDARGRIIEFECDPCERSVLGRKCKPVLDRCLERIHPSDVVELVNAISEVQRITDEEGKD